MSSSHHILSDGSSFFFRLYAERRYSYSHVILQCCLKKRKLRLVRITSELDGSLEGILSFLLCGQIGRNMLAIDWPDNWSGYQMKNVYRAERECSSCTTWLVLVQESKMSEKKLPCMFPATDTVSSSPLPPPPDGK